MSNDNFRIAFFCIPAHGHTNPTLKVVKALTEKGCAVRYYSYNEFKDKITDAGATFVSCDKYDNGLNLSHADGERISKDIAFSTKVLVRTTLSMDDALTEDIKAFAPHCIVADSMALWGKLIALKLGIPFVSSTTTFAFNRESSKIMKRSLGELITMLSAMPKANRELKKLRDKGYPVKNILSVIANDNDTETIVYTSKLFQPASESFSEKYHFVGPMVRDSDAVVPKTEKPLVYISMGTVVNNMPDFYRKCITAFAGKEVDVIISAGNWTDISSLGILPDNIKVYSSVDQIAVLKSADVFVTHCGMNSTNEALYYSVPLVMYPRTVEQNGVALRVKELGAGDYLCADSSHTICRSVMAVLEDNNYKAAADIIAQSFKLSGQAKKTAQILLSNCKKI